MILFPQVLLMKKDEKIVIFLAGFRVEIESVNYNLLAVRLAGYMSLPSGNSSVYRSEMPVIRIRMRQDEIDDEKAETLRCWESEGIEIPNVDDSYYEFLALRKKALKELAECHVLYLHGSAICVNRQGYLFTAPSGTGKSTHVRLWRERFEDEVIVVNDDKPLIRVENDEIYLCGSPWNGKHGLGCQMEVPLRAIVKLRRGETNCITPLSSAEAFRELFLQTHHFEDKEKMQAVMAMLAGIIERTQCYSLQCNKELNAAEVARAGIEERCFTSGAEKRPRHRNS